MNKKIYKFRIIDKVISRYLKIAGVICIEGLKWCGKTWIFRHVFKSEFLVGNFYNNFVNR